MFLKIYQLNIIKKIKKDYEKSLGKISKSFQRRKRKNSDNMDLSVIKISKKMKNNSSLGIEENIIE